MRHSLALLSAFLVIGLTPAADRDLTRDVSDATGSADLFDAHTLTAPLISEAEIPTDFGTWQSCCSHKDCMEAPVTVDYHSTEWARVTIGEFPSFDLETRKIYPSKNGKDYFCRRDLSRPPDTRNTRCVFVGRAKQVRALQRGKADVS